MEREVSKRRKQALQAVLGALLACLASTASAGDIAAHIVIEAPWVMAAPPDAKVMAAYMRISNRGAAPVALRKAESEDFAAVELHMSMMHQGMAHMMQVEEVPIAAGATFELAPGGYHLMLMEPGRALRSGDSVMLKLHFSNGEVVEVNAPVRPTAP